MRFYIILLCLLSFAFRVNALEVTCTPGGLAEAVGTNTDVASLTVNGEMNVVDFDFITEYMPELTTLTVNAKIVAYSGAMTRNGSGESPAGCLPAFALFGTKIKNLTLDGNITTYGEASLADTRIENLTINDGTTSLPANLCNGLTTLKTVELPASVIEIGASAFSGCTGLVSVSAPAVKKIAREAFLGCTALTEFSFPATLTEIGDGAFAATGLQTVDLTEATTLSTLGDRVFAQCESLREVSLPEGLKEIPVGGFFCDAEILSFGFPSTLTAVNDYSMAGLSKLNPKESPRDISGTSVTTLGNYAMANWNACEQLTVPYTLSYLGDNAMQGWASLTVINVPEAMTAVPELGENVWLDTPQNSIYLNVESMTLAEEMRVAEQWKEFIITDLSTDAPQLSDDLSDGAINVTFRGTRLHVSASDVISRLAVYDSMGRCYTILAPCAVEAEVETDGWDCRFFIVVVNTADGKSLSKKLVRK